MHIKLNNLIIFPFLLLLFKSSIVFCQIPMETIPARLQDANSLEFKGAFEFKTSNEIKEKSIPLEFTYGLTNRFELDFLATVYTSISSTAAPYASGFGDLEVTLLSLLSKEHRKFPAIALGGEVKIPTAKNPLLGTQKFDYSAYIIASKKFGNLDTHINFEYTFVGQPTEMQLRNIYSFSIAGEYELSKKLELVAELSANTSSFLKETDDERQINPQVIPGELAGLIGARYRLFEKLKLISGIKYNNNKAFLIRTGIIYYFQ
jgi:Putative MetA-pathway of phenol degradation